MNDRPRRLQRNPDDKVIAGVASGVADFFGLDPTIVRVVWALTILLGGLGVIVYIILWIVVPEGDSDRTVAHDLRDGATGSTEPPDAGPPHGDGDAAVEDGTTDGSA